MIKRFKALLFLIAFILLFPALPSCAIVGGAAIGAAGATVIYDRRNIQSIVQDENISKQIIMKLRQDPAMMRQAHIVVSTYHKMVLLAGQSPNTTLQTEAENIAKSIPDIARLYNQITIQGPTSSLTRMSDSVITTKVKTALLVTKHLQSGQFKVVTENGTVFLMGIVTRSQANLAVNIARQVNGVQKVVKIFQYTRDLEKPLYKTTKTVKPTPSHTTYIKTSNNHSNDIPMEI